MSDTKQISVPVTGMTCANCVASVERNIKKVNGVSVANVNLTTERASVEYDAALTNLDDIMARIERAGYGIAVGEADIIVHRMSDDNDARRLQKTLDSMDGVINASVNFTTERARIKYVPTIVSQSDLRRAISATGFEAVETGGNAEDAEQIARDKEIATQRHLLIVGLIFTLPLFLLSMGRDMEPDWRLGASTPGQLVVLRAGHTGAVLCWLAVLHRRI